MKIAVPVSGGQVCPHFGHCEQFAMFDIDPQTNTVVNMELQVPPPHEPGVLPQWLSEKGATTIIAGGMGMRAQQLFAQNGVKVVVGAAAGDPRATVEAYLAGSLIPGQNPCDH
ncbi:MAG TPA: NifB/NifX family molybdenum-iron cluster-binding protein [Acidobacteriota bacterium]|nr:NifB/NifX family molybdenum-iron cluster-binding protein [Acidobacteriota bacterium]